MSFESFFLNYQLPGFRGENAPPLENKELDEFVPEVGIKEASHISQIYLRQVILIRLFFLKGEQGD